MGSEIRGVSEAPPLARERRSAVGSAAGAVGLYLARERRLRGISLDDLAALTKIPRRSLDRLEAGAFDGQNDGFARGFVRTVAVALGLVPEEAVMRLMGEPGEADQLKVAQRARSQRWLLAGAAAVTLAAALAGVAWVWRSAGERPEAPPDTSEIVYRRDAVRALADSQAHARRSGPVLPGASAAEAGRGQQLGVVAQESVESVGGDHPN